HTHTHRRVSVDLGSVCSLRVWVRTCVGEGQTARTQATVLSGQRAGSQEDSQNHSTLTTHPLQVCVLCVCVCVVCVCVCVRVWCVWCVCVRGVGVCVCGVCGRRCGWVCCGWCVCVCCVCVRVYAFSGLGARKTRFPRILCA